MCEKSFLTKKTIRRLKYKYEIPPFCMWQDLEKYVSTQE